ncbi:MAG: FmdE family protein [Chloroflexi bacterium]|nr:FmdE family protein [Chloroflexota bacterium]
MENEFNRIGKFHGHQCPGLAIGYRMTKAGISVLGESRSEDEELVAIVENNACGVDAVQYLTGCTFGKGNLIFKDYGKHVYTFYSRKTKKAVHIAFKFDSLPKQMRSSKQELINWILTANSHDILDVREISIAEPELAKAMKSIKCEICGENVMETRIQKVDGKNICIPCSKNT